MLTLRQLLIISGQNPGQTLSTNLLRAKFSARPLSLKSVIAAYEKQRFIVIVILVSTKILRSHNLRSISDLVRAAQTDEGQLGSDEVLALSSNLREQGLSLRLLDKGLRTAAIVGLAPSLVNAPAVLVNAGNLLNIQDKYSGAEAIGGTVLAVGAVGVGVTIAIATAPAWVLFGSAFLVGFGAGVAVTAGVMDILHDSPPAPRSDSQEITPTPNDVGPDGPDGGTIEIPNAVAVGSPPEGFDTDGVLEQLGNFAVNFSIDIALSALPVGFDPDTGAGLPGFPGGDDGDVGDGGLPA